MQDICCELVMALIFSRILQSLRSPIDTIIDTWDAGRSEDVFSRYVATVKGLDRFDDVLTEDTTASHLRGIRQHDAQYSSHRIPYW
jgi:hypothetical protein